MIDRIGICEVFSCLAHDYGLYGIATRLEQMGFRPSPMLNTDRLDDWQTELYQSLEDRAMRTDPYARRLAAR